MNGLESMTKVRLVTDSPAYREFVTQTAKQLTRLFYNITIDPECPLNDEITLDCLYSNIEVSEIFGRDVSDLVKIGTNQVKLDLGIES